MEYYIIEQTWCLNERPIGKLIRNTSLSKSCLTVPLMPITQRGDNPGAWPQYPGQQGEAGQEALREGQWAETIFKWILDFCKNSCRVWVTFIIVSILNDCEEIILYAGTFINFLCLPDTVFVFSIGMLLCPEMKRTTFHIAFRVKFANLMWVNHCKHTEITDKKCV